MNKMQGLFVVVHAAGIEGPTDYQQALFIWQIYIESGNDARIAKLTWLD